MACDGIRNAMRDPERTISGRPTRCGGDHLFVPSIKAFGCRFAAIPIASAFTCRIDREPLKSALDRGRRGLRCVFGSGGFEPPAQQAAGTDQHHDAHHRAQSSSSIPIEPMTGPAGRFGLDTVEPREHGVTERIGIGSLLRHGLTSAPTRSTASFGAACS